MQMLLVLLILIVLAILIALDVRQKLDLGHPVFVLLTALGYFCSVVWTAALALLALIETLDGGSLLVWVQVALSTSQPHSHAPEEGLTGPAGSPSAG